MDRAAPPRPRRRAGRARADRLRPRLHRPAVPGHPARLRAVRRRHPDLLREDLHPRTTRPELDKAINLARELRASGVAVTLVVHEPKRLGRDLELAALAEQLKAPDVGLQFLTGALQCSHDPSGVVFTVLAALSGMERRTPDGARIWAGHGSWPATWSKSGP
ncbi:MAG: recombinase family protein [Actinomycetota bacterium]|nr:recombinase family protein [Actinomycetota bacterium]